MVSPKPAWHGTLVLGCGIRMPGVVRPDLHVISGVNVSHKQCTDCDSFVKYNYGNNGYCTDVSMVNVAYKQDV